MNNIKRGIGIGITAYAALTTFIFLNGVERGIVKSIKKGQNDAEKKEESAEESENR